MSLMEGNMRAMYEATSWGWNQSEKEEEFRDKDSRFIHVRIVGAAASSTASLAAFVNYRVAWDDEGESLVICPTWSLLVHQS